MAFSFFGGVHPKENKHTRDIPAQRFPQPDLLVVSMSQHIGVPCVPLVKKGDPVKKGQKIGDNQGLCVPVHASVSGTVKAVEARPHSNGTTVMSVVIENDHQDTLHEDIQPRSQQEVDRLLDKISATGINSLTEEELATLRKVREHMNHPGR